MRVFIVERVEQGMSYECRRLDAYKIRISEKIKRDKPAFIRGRLRKYKTIPDRLHLNVNPNSYYPPINIALYTRMKIVMPGDGYVRLRPANCNIGYVGGRVKELTMDSIDIPPCAIANRNGLMEGGYVCIDYWYLIQIADLNDIMNKGATVHWKKDKQIKGDTIG